MDDEITRINSLTFGQLRNELANCTDPVRQYIIRNLMFIRYNQYLKNKEIKQEMKKDYKRKQIKKIKKKIEDKYKFNDLDLFIDEIDDAEINNEEIINEEIINGKPSMKDKTNKNLRNRMQNDIDINKNNTYTSKIKKDFVPPFTNENDDRYATFEGAFKLIN